MTISLRCGESIFRDFSTKRQLSAFVPGVRLTLTEEEKLKLALDALSLTNEGVADFAEAEKELLDQAKALGVECGPCPNGGNRCELAVSIEGHAKPSEIQVISVAFEVQQPGNVQGMRIVFNYTLSARVKLFCDPCDCEQ